LEEVHCYLELSVFGAFLVGHSVLILRCKSENSSSMKSIFTGNIILNPLTNIQEIYIMNSMCVKIDLQENHSTKNIQDKCQYVYLWKFISKTDKVKTIIRPIIA